MCTCNYRHSFYMQRLCHRRNTVMEELQMYKLNESMYAKSWYHFKLILFSLTMCCNTVKRILFNKVRMSSYVLFWRTLLILALISNDTAVWNWLGFDTDANSCMLPINQDCTDILAILYRKISLISSPIYSCGFLRCLIFRRLTSLLS